MRKVLIDSAAASKTTFLLRTVIYHPAGRPAACNRAQSRTYEQGIPTTLFIGTTYIAAKGDLKLLAGGWNDFDDSLYFEMALYLYEASF